MTSQALDSLFSPLALGPVHIANRIVSTAHQTTLVHDHLPTADFVAYHEARARGGTGLIVLEATAVHPSGDLTAHTLGGYLPAIVGGYQRVKAAVAPHGTKLFVQLFHGGREQIAGAPRPPALAPSAVPSQRFRTEPRALTAAEIDEIVAGYATAATLAAEAGLDGVEISAAHRYLLEQFLDPTLNTRDDEWRDGRRFVAAVVGAVRAAVPGLCLGVRLSADSERVVGIVDLLAALGVDYVSLALGDSSTYLGSVGIVPPPPISDGAIVEPAQRFTGVLPRITTGRIADPALADRVIADGRAEAVGMTRALITDPDMPAKARTGRLEQVERCIGCNTCIAHYHAELPIACAVNPRTGRELHLAAPVRAAHARRVVVVGGGPAGIAAALDAAAAGHDVVLLEQADRLGGQIALAGAAPGGAYVAQRFADNIARRLAQTEVDVRLETKAEEAAVLALEPDGVVVATGAVPYPGDVPGIAAWDVLAGHVPDGERILVADWGGDPGGLDAAELLAAAGKRVTYAVSSLAVGELVHQYRRNLYLQRLYRAGVTIRHHLELVATSPPTMRNMFARELEETFEADAVVLALGRIPAPVFTVAGVLCEPAGDCRSPRSLEEAVLEGTRASRTLAAAW